ncbi:MAG: hypothetical protein ACREJ5_20670 [Geminicoccaceae bacterium]
MDQARHIHRRLLATLLAALALAVHPLAAQAPDEDVFIEESVDEALLPLTAREIRQAVSALQRDVGVGDQRVLTVSVDRHEEDEDAPADQRRADVILYNYDTNETIAAVVTLDPRPQVEELMVTPDQAPGLGTEEVEEARQLALADPTVQAELRANDLTGRERELIITHIRFQTQVPDDPCSTDRCVLLFFNTPEAVLDIEPVVNLTTGEVAIQ